MANDKESVPSEKTNAANESMPTGRGRSPLKGAAAKDVRSITFILMLVANEVYSDLDRICVTLHSFDDLVVMYKLLDNAIVTNFCASLVM